MPKDIISKNVLHKALYRKMLMCACVELLVVALLGLNFAYREYRKPDLVISARGREKHNQGLFYGSRSSKKFGFPWCSGPARLKPQNRVIFSSFDEAITAGFEPTKVCKGLKNYKSVG
jgi:hypothetical protein